MNPIPLVVGAITLIIPGLIAQDFAMVTGGVVLLWIMLAVMWGTK